MIYGQKNINIYIYIYIYINSNVTSDKVARCNYHEKKVNV